MRISVKRYFFFFKSPKYIPFGVNWQAYILFYVTSVLYTKFTSLAMKKVKLYKVDNKFICIFS